MSNDVEREAFEKALSENRFFRHKPGSYAPEEVEHIAWMVWQAARAHPEPPSGVPGDWFHCPDCGTHEVEITQQCNNSDCRGYTEDLTLYEGWKDTKPYSEQGGEWVSVADKLPAENKGYMGWLQKWLDGELEESDFEFVLYAGKGVFRKYEGGNFVRLSMHEQVTHWMPLPQPPKSKEGTCDDYF